MSLKKTFDHLSWKQISILNLGLVLMFITFLSLRIVQTPTSVSPKATTQPSPIPKDPNPLKPSLLYPISPAFAKPGDNVRIQGTNLGSYPHNSHISIAGQPLNLSSIINWTDTYIDLIIPPTLAANQIVPISLNLNHQPISIQNLAIYHPSTSPQLGIDVVGDNYHLWIDNAPSSWIQFTLTNPSDSTKFLLEQQPFPANTPTDSNTHRFQITTHNKTIIFSNPTIPQLSDLKIFSSKSLDTADSAFYIHPLNPLFAHLQ